MAETLQRVSCFLGEATEHGQGMMADAAVRSTPGLVRLDVAGEPPSPSVYLAFCRELRHIPRVRLVIDALAAALRDELH